MPTPAHQFAVTLTSGSTMLVERSVTYGDIAIVISIAFLIIVLLAIAFVAIPRLWPQR